MTPAKSSIPFYRDGRVLSALAQLAFLLLVVAGVVTLAANLQRGLAAQNLNTSFEFLGQPASFDIGEGTERLGYAVGASSFLDAFSVGLYNTLRVAIIGIVLATALGLVMGIARLSSNWLVNRLALVYVEVIRNTPLLVQLVFWYFAVILQLPDVRQAFRVGDIYLSQRGLSLPWPVPTEGFGALWPWLAAALVAGLGVYVALARRRAAGRPSPAGLAGWGAGLGVAVVGYLAAGSPLSWSVPTLGNFGTIGGASLTPEFTALLVALVVYTGAFIAEIVRAGIQAVPKGQWEAGRSLGLGYGAMLRLVVLPQALRIILPPLGNQYLNLTKNSSLAVAIGYPDLFNVANTAGNQSGANVQALLIVLVTYLVLSLAIATLVNLLGRGVRLRAR